MALPESTTRRSILVIDDDAAVRELIVATLAAEGYDVVAASDGDRAIAAAAAAPPDLVISDVQMPGTSGYDVCRRVRDRFGDIPFMFVSGTRTEPYDRVAGFEFGADDYLTKPFDPSELAARVRALLRRPRAPARAGEGAHHAGLTAREHEILGLLASGSSTGDIAAQLVLSPKTVSKHMERILRKLNVNSRAEAVAAAYRDRLV